MQRVLEVDGDELTLLLQVSEGTLDQLWGPFELQGQFIPLLTQHRHLCLEVCNAPSVHGK